MSKINEKANETAASKGLVRLSRRLLAVADFVRPGSRIADVGTDHGYVPVYLAQTGSIASALAMDVGKGPLERAMGHIREYEEWAAGQAEKTSLCPVTARLSDGLTALRPGEADTVVMAGMGGNLVIRILEQGRHVWNSVDHWILSPQSDLDKVRLYLEKNGFLIEDEAMLCEDGNYYSVLKVVRGAMEYGRGSWYRYGKIPIGRKDRVLKEYLEKEKNRIEGILRQFEAQPPGPMTESRKTAMKSLWEEWNLIKEAQDEMQ